MAKKLKTIKVGSDAGLLIAQGCKLKKEEKKIKEDLDDVKEKLAKLKIKNAGKYENTAGDSLTISEISIFSEIQPKRLFNYLVKNKKKSRFWECVKVNLTNTSKVIPAKVIDKMRDELNSSFRFNYK